MFIRLNPISGEQQQGPRISAPAYSRGGEDFPAYYLDKDSRTIPTDPTNDGWVWVDSLLDAPAAVPGWSNEAVIHEPYEPLNISHLRIYGLDQTPASFLRANGPTEPPLDLMWGLLKLTEVKVTTAVAKGDIFREEFYSGDLLICALENEITKREKGTKPEAKLKSPTPVWYRNDGSEFRGTPPEEPKEYFGNNLIGWKMKARETVQAFLMNAIPATLLDKEVFPTLEDCQNQARVWLFGYGSTWLNYVKYGGASTFLGILENDNTAWLSERVSSEIVPGAKINATIKTLIEDALP